MSEPALPSAGRRWLIIIAVMAATLMQVLDSTIANVALPRMQAALGATPESIVWVLTSYIIMAAIATPITGWLETRFGRRNLFAISIAGFTLSSAACGAATSLEMMVAARALQGICGAFMAPLGQATLLDSSPREKHTQVLTIWGMGMMIGPVIGPVLGGWLTDNYGWRWVFLINLPIGIVTLVAIWLLVDKANLRRRPFDVIGFGLLAVMLASFQLMLDRGSQRDWFESTEILIEAGLTIGCLWMFVVHIVTAKSPVLSLALFRDRNFNIATIFSVIITGVVMAGAVLLAPMLQVLMGYDPMSAGMLIVPRAMGVIITMPLVNLLAGKVDSRVLVATGMGMTAISLWMMTGFDLEMGKQPVILTGFIQGAGLGLCTLPLNILAFSTLEPRLRTEGASFYNLSRNLGASISISIVGALLARNVQVSHADLGAHVTTTKFPFVQSGIIEQIGVQSEAVIRMIDSEVNRQALMIAYLDDFWLMQWVALLAIPLVLFLRGDTGQSAKPPVLVE